MSNENVYAAGLLDRALDPATQPPEIQAFLRAELDLLPRVVPEGVRVIDVGCGTGRHLLELRDRLRLGVGVDYEHRYITEAHRRAAGSDVHFITADATAIPVRSSSSRSDEPERAAQVLPSGNRGAHDARPCTRYIEGDLQPDGGHEVSCAHATGRGRRLRHRGSSPSLLHQPGATRDEAVANIREAIAGYLESLEARGEAIPPSITEEIVEV